MGLTSNQTAILTARAGAGRAGAMRAGFAPRDTRGLTAGSSPKPFYLWARVYPGPKTWTVVKS